MWNRLAPYVLRLLDMWNRLALYILRLIWKHDPRPASENEVIDNINLCYHMVDEEADSTTATGGDYDVFFSFRGCDTRYGFTDCLYEFMRQAGIRVYRDNEELQPGENISEILRAVKSSKIFIPIFSKGYASSKWCLEELACMVKSTRQSMRKMILPIFYDVDPLDVKLETKLYKSALNEHEGRYGCTQVKLWKEALTTVGRIKGWHLKVQRHGKAMAEITQKVLQKIAIRKRYLPTNLVGIDDRIDEIQKLLDRLNTSDIRFVIIHGIGGIGKTTLAKAVFNQLSSRFESYSFLSNIQESSQDGGIEKMQRKLVADLFGFLLAETFDFEDGNNIIKDRLPNKRVLLVFYGMDENDQYMQLVKHCTSCGPGSRIIITTRDKSSFPIRKVGGLEGSILTGSIKFFLYEMKEMHFDHAIQLFNKLAFNADTTPCDLYELSREVVELTGGLPLAVEVIASHLRGQSRVTWIRTLKKLKEVPPEEVQQRLKISYDALNYRAQQIYLDIACLFVNKKKTNPMYVWEDCGFFPEDQIEVLINKSLIKIGDDNRIWMHDLLRALGREIVRQEHMRKPEDRSRSWLLEMAPKMGTDNRAALTRRRSGHNFTRKDFANLTNAKFLELDGGNFVGNFEDILPELRWFCWRNCPPNLEAYNFVLKHLVVLKLSGNIITEEWSGWAQIMVASNLKVLSLAGSKSLTKTPRFPQPMSLERLVLKDFISLAEIDPSIGRLERLSYLKIKWCPSLRKLPEEIGCLTALRELILIHCFSVRYLPESIGNPTLLSRLLMEGTGIVKLPHTIKGLVNLEYLSLANCTSLYSLPDAFGELKSLTELDLSGTTIEELPPSLWKLHDLTLRVNSSNIRTRMRDLPLLEEVKEVPLKEVREEWRMSYDELDYGVKQIFLDIACFFDDKKKTNAMYMWDACGFSADCGIEDLINKSLISISDRGRIWMDYKLREFGKEIVRRENIEKPGDQRGLRLPKITMDRVPAEKPQGAEDGEPLTLWKLRHDLTREDFANLTNARFLELNGNNFAGDFTDILPQLRWLCWRNCPRKLQANNFFLDHLVVLKLSGDITTEEWSRWVEIMVPSKLKVLKLAGFRSFVQTPCFSKFMSLERLILKDFPNLVRIDRSISKLKRLIYLKTKCCPHLRELPQEIGSLTALKELILIKSYKVRYLPDSIGNLRGLSRLIMEDTGLIELPGTVKGLVDLECLCLVNCVILNSLSDAVGELKSLTKLDLSGTNIEELPPLLWNLEVLTLRIGDGKIKRQLMRYRPLMEDLEICLDIKKEPRPDEAFDWEMFSVNLLDYPAEILSQGSRAIVSPGFHENHLSGRCLLRILARVIFSQGNESSINIAVEVPLWGTRIMSSPQPLLYLKNLILMLAAWLERKWGSEWMCDFQRKDEALFSLEFCNQCMCITSEIRGFSPAPPCLETFDRFPELSISFSITLYEPWHSTQINLQLKHPWSSEKLLDYIERWNSGQEEATQVQGLEYKRSFDNCMSSRPRKAGGRRLRTMRRRILSWLCCCRTT